MSISRHALILPNLYLRNQSFKIFAHGQQRWGLVPVDPKACMCTLLFTATSSNMEISDLLLCVRLCRPDRKNVIAKGVRILKGWYSRGGVFSKSKRDSLQKFHIQGQLIKSWPASIQLYKNQDGHKTFRQHMFCLKTFVPIQMVHCGP